MWSDALCFAGIIVASAVTFASPYMGSGHSRIATASCLIAFCTALLLWMLNSILFPCNIRDINQFKGAASALAAWVGACSIWATHDTSAESSGRLRGLTIVLSIGSIVVVTAQLVLSKQLCKQPLSCNKKPLSSSMSQSLLAASANDDEFSVHQFRKGYGMHSRSNLQRCKLLGFALWVTFVVLMAIFAFKTNSTRDEQQERSDAANCNGNPIDPDSWILLQCGQKATCELKKLGGSPNPDITSGDPAGINCTTDISGKLTPNSKCKISLDDGAMERFCPPGLKVVLWNDSAHRDWRQRQTLAAEAARITFDPTNLAANSTHVATCHLGEWQGNAACDYFNLTDLIIATAPTRLARGARKILTLDMNNPHFLCNRPPCQYMNGPEVAAPCVTVHTSAAVNISGRTAIPRSVWRGAAASTDKPWFTNRSNPSMDGRQAKLGLLFDVLKGGNLSLTRLDIRRARTHWLGPDACGGTPDTFCDVNSIRVQGSASVTNSHLQAIRVVVGAEGSLKVDHSALVPAELSDRRDGQVDRKFHASALCVCNKVPDLSHNFKPTQPCEATGPSVPGPFVPGKVFVSNSILVLVYLFNSPPKEEASSAPLFHFSNTRFYQAAQAKSMASFDKFDLDPIIPVSRGVGTASASVRQPELSPLDTAQPTLAPWLRRDILSASYNDCSLADCTVCPAYCHDTTLSGSHDCSQTPACPETSSKHSYCQDDLIKNMGPSTEFKADDGNSKGSTIFATLRSETRGADSSGSTESPVRIIVTIRKSIVSRGWNVQTSTALPPDNYALLSLDILDKMDVAINAFNSHNLTDRPFLNVMLKSLDNADLSSYYCSDCSSKLTIHNLRLDCSPYSSWLIPDGGPDLTLANVSLLAKHVLGPNINYGPNIPALHNVAVFATSDPMSTPWNCEKTCLDTADSADPLCSPAVTLDWKIGAFGGGGLMQIEQQTKKQDATESAQRSETAVAFPSELTQQKSLPPQEQPWIINYNMSIRGKYMYELNVDGTKLGNYRLKPYGGSSSWQVQQRDGMLATLNLSDLILSPGQSWATSDCVSSAQATKGVTVWRDEWSVGKSVRCPQEGPVIVGSGGSVVFTRVVIEWLAVQWKRYPRMEQSPSVQMNLLPMVALPRLHLVDCMFILQNSPKPFAKISVSAPQGNGFNMTLMPTDTAPDIFLDVSQFIDNHTIDSAAPSPAVFNISGVHGATYKTPLILRRLRMPKGVHGKPPVRVILQNINLTLFTGEWCKGQNASNQDANRQCVEHVNRAACERGAECQWKTGDNKNFASRSKLELRDVWIPSTDVPAQAQSVAGKVWDGLTRWVGEACDGHQWCAAGSWQLTQNLNAAQNPNPPWMLLNVTSDRAILDVAHDSPADLMMPQNFSSHVVVRGQGTQGCDGPVFNVTWSTLSKSCSTHGCEVNNLKILASDDVNGTKGSCVAGSCDNMTLISMPSNGRFCCIPKACAGSLSVD
jgi:hypothetical protein